MTTRQRPPTRGTPLKASTPKPGTAKPPPHIPSQKTPGTTEPGRKVVVYGPSGVGKTDMIAHWGRVAFITDAQEEGILDLSRYEDTPAPAFQHTVDTFGELLSMCNKVAKMKDIDCLCVDSLTGMEKLCFISHCDEYFEGDWSSKGFYSYSQGPKNAAKTDWPRFLDHLETVRLAGIDVVLIAHSQVKPFSNPEGADYERYIPYLDKETWQQTHRWAQAVLFYNYFVDIIKTGAKHKPEMSEDHRQIYTVHSAAYDAKNRFNMPPVVDAGHDGKTACQNLLSAMQRVL